MVNLLKIANLKKTGILRQVFYLVLQVLRF